ncbi:competence protein ComK [Anaerobacillus sp. MEB173]|uniref:competence protein ComK n=1 Tax=Anaerobacillus sp. MEB173 TaxID=3383345 RepID=UPI003F90D9D0
MHTTGVKQKVPIPIDPVRKIYAIPTHSAAQYECHWFFYHHIRAIESDRKDENLAVVVVSDHRQINVNVSRYTLEKQLQRAAVCVVRFSGLICC